MKLSIHTLQKTLFSGEVEKIIARTTAGEITVLDNHLPIVTPLEGPELKIIDKSGKCDIIKVGSGFIEVRPQSRVIVLANTA